MRKKENAVYSAGQRAQGFLDENEAALGTTVDFSAARKRLDDVVAEFAVHAVEQNVNDRDTRGETAKQLQLRLHLLTDIMRPIAEIARRNLRTTPEFESLHMPRQVYGPAFLASAKGMATAATIHKEVLIERGMPADFLEQFQSALKVFETSVNDREKSRTMRIGATQGLAVQEQECRSVLKVLDALVGRALRGNPVLLATWKSARAIHRRPGGSGTSSTPSSTAPATPAATTPAVPPASSTSPTATAA